MEHWGFQVPILIHTADSLASIIDQQPFKKVKNVDLAAYYCTLLSEPMDATKLHALLENEVDRWVAGDQVIYIYCPGGYGKTKWNNQFFEKKLKQPTTTRNHATMSALLEMAATL